MPHDTVLADLRDAAGASGDTIRAGDCDLDFDLLQFGMPDWNADSGGPRTFTDVSTKMTNSCFDGLVAHVASVCQVFCFSGWYQFME